MAMVIAIDPGKHALGWSAWGNHLLVACGLARAEGRDLGQLAATLACQLPTGADVAVVERMVHAYTRIKVKGQAAMTRVAADLLDLQAIAGFVAGHSIAEGGKVEWFAAHQWKGDTPKEVTEKRIRKALGPEEMEVYHAALMQIPKGLRHNMVDGVGLGLFYRGRVSPAIRRSKAK
jgi:hypothetical protein